MKIIIEGARCTGKSTLAKNLNDLTGAAVYHATSETDNSLAWHTKQLMDGEDKILDRFQIGEIVYSKYYNRSPKIRIREMFMMPSLAHDSLFIILHMGSGDERMLRHRMKKRFLETGRPFSFNDLDEAMFANDWFTVIGSMMQMEHDNVIMIDTENLTEKGVFEEVKRELEKRNLW